MQTTRTSLRTLAALLTGLLITHLAPAATYLWDVATPGANNWNVNANWSPATGNPGASDTAIFGAVGTGFDALTANNIVSVNTTVTSLSYTNTGSGVWHVTGIPAGVTLTVSGATTIGGLTSSTTAGLLTSVAMVDAGTLSLNGNLTMGDAGSNFAASPVDFSGLSNFVYNASTGIIALGNGTRSAVTWKLAAASNSITAGTINANTPNTSSSGTANVTLGAGTNIFNVGAFNLAAGRTTSTLSFPAGSTGGGLRIRGITGTDDSLANMTLGNHNTSGSGSTSAGTLSLNGYPVDLRLGTLTLGLSSASPTGNSPGNGTVSFDMGTVYASSIVMGVSSGTASALANGTINVGANGKLTVGTGGMSLANQSATSGAATGTLNVNGGTVVCSNSITKASASGTGTLNLSSGSLTMASGVIGTAAVPIDTLSIGDSALTLAISQNTTNVFVTTLTITSSTNNTINIASLPVITSYPVQYPILKYGSYFPVFVSDFLIGSVPAGSPAYTGYISNNVANSTLEVVLTGGPAPLVQVLTWNGTPTGDWNTSTANWQGSKTYHQGDYVLFDDTASGSTSVNLATTLTPGVLTVSNSTKSYTFSGTGAIDGAVALTKDGAGQFTLANSGVNTFSNGVSILAGTLKLSGSSDRLPTNSIVTLADVPGAKLDLNNLNQTLRSLNGGGLNGGDVTLGSAILTDWSGGTYGGVISGSGQLVKTNVPGGPGGVLTLTNANTYTGGTIIGGYTNNTTLAVANQTGSGTGSGFVRVLTNGTFVFGGGGPGGSVTASVITNNGVVRLNRSDDFTFANIIVGAGALQIQNTNTVTITGTNGYTGGTTINPGILRISHPGALGSGPITIANSAPAVLQLTNGITVTNSLFIGSKPSGSGAVPNVENLSGTNTLTGPISLTANGSIGWLFYATADRLLISGAMTPLNASQTSQNTTRTLWLRGDAVGEWSGNIIDPVGGTTNLTLRKDGLGTWILSGANTYTAPTVVSNGTLLVNGSLSASSAVTAAGGTVGGTGVINGPVVVNADGTLAPGKSIGGLTINNSLTLNGTNVMEVSHAATDRVVGLTNVTFGGTLQVIVQGTLTGGEIFKLFSSTAYNGDFVTYDLPALSPPLGWDTTKMAVDGTLRVTGGTPTQPSLQVSQSGSQLTFAWNNVSFKLQAQTNTHSAGISGNWADYPGGGYSPVSVTVNPANPTVFFRLAPL